MSEEETDINTAIANESVKNLENVAGSPLSARRSRLRSALKTRTITRSAGTETPAEDAPATGTARSRIAARRQARMEQRAKGETDSPTQNAENQASSGDAQTENSGQEEGDIRKSEEASAKPKSALARFRSALSKVRNESAKKNEVAQKVNGLKEKFQEKLALKDMIKQSLRFGAFTQVVERMNEISRQFSASVADIVVTVAPQYTPQYGEFRRKQDRLWEGYETDTEKLKYLDEVNIEDITKIRAAKVAEGIAAVKALQNQPASQKIVGKAFSKAGDMNFNQAVCQLAEKLGNSPYSS